ncbi:O-dinitrobenzene, calcium and zinc resistance protein [Scheffersomyces xylosifermentans]|uniref:O-dinitrobenzene, calcium and zinc resistance protein n=1 Tax=Scheffersomyces xylosifermentans TaxID=1304137 RepID=UPI00315C8590
MIKKPSSSKSTSLFDIRLKNLDHDVLVLKGNPQDAASVLLSGKIALAVNEPIQIKRFTLRLYANLRMQWTENLMTSKGPYSKPNKFSKKVYEYVWDNVEFNQYLNNLYENTSHTSSSIGLSRNHSTASLKNLGSSLRTKSSTNLQLSSSSLSTNGVTSHGSSTNLASSSGKTSNHTLVSGNYEFPFSAVLPGDMPESIEGLPGASLVYRLEATIDRGKFHTSLLTKKHIRVIRTMTTDAVELSETVAVDNTWPKKVEYSLNVPCKAIAIGSGTPISFMLVPLLKGLRLGAISIKLVEFYSYLGYIPPSYNGERVVCEKTIEKPSEDDPNFQMDKWEIDTFLRIPPSLSKCTQDCDISSHLKVRHKLKFVIGLVNPDGHVSELRASLPVQLFISPFVTIKATHDDPEEVSVHKDVVPDFNAEEEELFNRDSHSTSNTSLSELAETQANNGQLRSNPNSHTSFNGFMAPPLYEKHIYDRLWSDVSPIESPLNSGASTPRNYNLPQNDVQQTFSMSPLDSVQLNENLRQLSLQRQMQEYEALSSPSSVPQTPSGIDEDERDRAVFNLGESEGTISNDYFSRRVGNGGRPNLNRSASSNLYLLSPGVQSPPNHISRIHSESNLLDTSRLSKVPSYNQAIRGDANEAISPAYEPPLPGSNINLTELNKKFEELQAVSPPHSTLVKNKSFLSRGSSSMNLRNLGAKSTSNNSSPNQSRNKSSNSDGNSNSSSGVNIAHNSHSISPNNSFLTQHGSSPIFSMTPLPSTSPVHKISFKGPAQDLPPHLLHSSSTSSVTKPSSSAADRSAALNGGNKSASSLSLHNLQFMNRKKGEKK